MEAPAPTPVRIPKDVLSGASLKLRRTSRAGAARLGLHNGSRTSRNGAHLLREAHRKIDRDAPAPERGDSIGAGSWELAGRCINYRRALAYLVKGGFAPEAAGIQRTLMEIATLAVALQGLKTNSFTSSGPKEPASRTADWPARSMR